MQNLKTYIFRIKSYIATASFGAFDSFMGTDNKLLPPEPGFIGTDKYMNISNRSDVEGLLVQIVNFALWFLGFAFLIVIVYGGILYLLAGSDEENASKARKVITMGIIGLVVIFLSYAIVFSLIMNFYLGAATSTNFAF